MYGRYICLWKVLILFGPKILPLTYQRYTHTYSHCYQQSVLTMGSRKHYSLAIVMYD